MEPNSMVKDTTGSSCSSYYTNLPTGTATLSDARVKAIHMVPELATHTWQDDYFIGNGSHDIIAVFDHPDTINKQRQYACFLGFISSLFVVLLLREYIRTRTNLLFYMSMTPFCLLSIGMSCDLWRRSPPHVAVTSQGVIFYDGGRGYRGQYVYLFPFDDIRDITLVTLPSEGSKVEAKQQLVMKLTKSLSHYRNGWCNIGGSKISLELFKEPVLFRRLVMAFLTGPFPDMDSSATNESHMIRVHCHNVSLCA